MSNELLLKNVCQYYKGLDQQNSALDYLQSKVPPDVLAEFAKRWRSPVQTPASNLPVKAKFVMDLKPHAGLIYGELYFMDADNKQVRAYTATSGCTGHQGINDIWTPGKGPCPNLQGLSISTRGMYSPEVRGVAGWFYPILPQLMYGPNGITRSAIGLHADANVPGSAGCVVTKDINLFKNDVVPLMQKANAAGIAQLALEIKYS